MTHFAALLAMMPPPSQPGQQPSAPGWTGFVPLILMMVVFYFILIRPQQKKAKELEAMIKSIRKGDRVIASGGLVAIVVNVGEKTVTLRSADSKFEVLRTAITEITERGAKDDEPPAKS